MAQLKSVCRMAQLKSVCKMAQLKFVLLLLLLCSDYDVTEASEDVMTAILEAHEIDMTDMEIDGPDCPDVMTCADDCLLGRKFDHVTGCRICECRTSGEFEGDIEVTDSNYDRLVEIYGVASTLEGRMKRAADNAKKSEWGKDEDGNVRIPYRLYSMNDMKRRLLKKAIGDFNEKTCIRFVPKKEDDEDFVIFSGRGKKCRSVVGRNGGVQFVSLGNGCEKFYGKYLHEMMHVIGFWHEQSRGDRDKFVKIIQQNIRPGAEVNFRKMTSQWNSYGSPYDVTSLMHYDGKAFGKTKGAVTIVDRRTNQPVVQQRSRFSHEDLVQINTKYKCPAIYLQKLKATQIQQSEQQPQKQQSEQRCEDSIKGCSKPKCAFSRFKSDCRRTCGSCTGVSARDKEEDCRDLSTNCDATMTRCSRLSGMKTFCRKSCGFCGGSRCLDKQSSCVKFKRYYCGNVNLRKIAKENCRKTCGYC